MQTGGIIMEVIVWIALDGASAVGSDSQVTISPADKLRLLEYGQRLLGESRNPLAAESGGSLGRHRSYKGHSTMVI